MKPPGYVVVTPFKTDEQAEQFKRVADRVAASAGGSAELASLPVGQIFREAITFGASLALFMEHNPEPRSDDELFEAWYEQHFSGSPSPFGDRPH